MGDDHDAAKLFEQAAGRLVGYLAVRGTAPAEVDDIIQDTFLVVCRKGQEVICHPNPVAYIFRIAQGVASDRRRANQSRATRESKWSASDVRQVLDVADMAVGHETLRWALSQLTVEQREVVYLRDCADLPAADVAGILGVSIKAVQSRLARGEKSLRALLSGGRKEERS